MMINPLILKIMYVAFVVGTVVIRWPHQQRNKDNQIIKDEKTPLEKGLLFGVWLGMMLLPVVYIFTPLLSLANYTLHWSLQVLGMLLSICSLWLFYRSHKDLGKNWSVSLEVRQNHTLITQGIYKSIRHPMYTAIWLWVIVQPLLLNNYIAGLSGLLSFSILYFLRVGQEESMMVEQFGEQYLDYKKKTNRLIPKL